MERERLMEELSTLDETILFLALVVAGVLFSFRATGVQRQSLLAALEGVEVDTSAVYPLRHGANALLVGGLGYFLCLAARTWRQTDPGDPVASRSAQANLWAAVLVLAAAIIRFDDVEFLHASQV